MKVLFASSEVVPFAKTGGLADVAGSLPIALKKLGIDIRVIMPKYKCINSIANKEVLGKDIPLYFVEHHCYYNRDGLYGTVEGDYPDNLERFAYFSRRVLTVIKEDKFSPDIIHCNDWQTALIPVYLKSIFKNDLYFKKTKTLFTIHNLAYQGIFAKEEFPKLGLDWSFFNIEGFEFYGKLNLLKAGLIFSDFLNTVSPTYAKEIQTPEFGYGLEGVLSKRKQSLIGILNGIDYNVWDPLNDPIIPKRYGKKSLNNKYINKEYLQAETGLEINKNIPLLGIITRLADQKGLDLLSEIINSLCNLDLQFILLGTGEKKYHELFKKIKIKYPKKTSINLRFDAELARKIYAASDIFLMPSRYEPCGLGQMISLRYGTIPVVRKTGGLADTVEDFEPNSDTGNGFTFTAYEPQAFLEAIKRALNTYQNRKTWSKLVKRAFGYDFSWDKSAQEYYELYKRLLYFP